MRQLKAFHSKYGNANVPKKFPENPGLARWVEKIRRRKPHSFSDEQREALQSVGFTWRRANLQRFAHHWESMFIKLKEYRLKHGNTLVPTDYEENRALGNWVKNQRASWSKGTIDDDRKERLDSIGFVWQVSKSMPTGTKEIRKASPQMEFLWQQKYDLLKEFCKKTGHCRVPLIYPENQALGDWVNNQRIAMSEGRMRPDRKELLDEIGFCWKPSEQK